MLATAMVEAWTHEADGAKQRAEGARMVPFDPERLSAVVTLSLGRNESASLLFHEALLERREGLLRFRKGQAKVLNALAGLLQDHHVGEGFCVAIIITHDELNTDLHGSRPPVWVTPVGWHILRQTAELPPGF